MCKKRLLLSAIALAVVSSNLLGSQTGSPVGGPANNSFPNLGDFKRSPDSSPTRSPRSLGGSTQVPANGTPRDLTLGGQPVNGDFDSPVQGPLFATDDQVDPRDELQHVVGQYEAEVAGLRFERDKALFNLDAATSHNKALWDRLYNPQGQSAEPNDFVAALDLSNRVAGLDVRVASIEQTLRVILAQLNALRCANRNISGE